MKKMFRFLAAFLSLLTFTALVCSAAEGTVTYSGDAGEFIFEPGTAYSLTDLFPNFKDAMPGDVLTQKITVENKASKKVDVKIYLRSLGANDEVSAAFLNQLQLTVTEAKGSALFDAAADKTAGLTDWVLLGTLQSGGKTDLNVTLSVPITLENAFQEKIGYLNWQFKAEELKVGGCDCEFPFSWEDIKYIFSSVTALFKDIGSKTEGWKPTTLFDDIQNIIENLSAKCKEAEEKIKEEVREKLPFTGSDSVRTLLIPVAAIAVSTVVILLLHRKKKREKEAET